MKLNKLGKLPNNPIFKTIYFIIALILSPIELIEWIWIGMTDDISELIDRVIRYFRKMFRRKNKN